MVLPGWPATGHCYLGWAGAEWSPPVNLLGQELESSWSVICRLHVEVCLASCAYPWGGVHLSVSQVDEGFVSGYFSHGWFSKAPWGTPEPHNTAWVRCWSANVPFMDLGWNVWLFFLQAALRPFKMSTDGCTLYVVHGTRGLVKNDSCVGKVGF